LHIFASDFTSSAQLGHFLIPPFSIALDSTISLFLGMTSAMTSPTMGERINAKKKKILIYLLSWREGRLKLQIQSTE
jgi:hypothetical protein